MVLFELRNLGPKTGQVESMIIASTGSDKARALAAKEAGPEGPETWTDFGKSSCVTLRSGRDARVIAKTVKS
jgi:hypothetical protein